MKNYQDRFKFEVVLYVSNGRYTRYAADFLEIIEIIDKFFCDVNAYYIASKDNALFEVFYLED